MVQLLFPPTFAFYLYHFYFSFLTSTFSLIIGILNINVSIPFFAHFSFPFFRLVFFTELDVMPERNTSSERSSRESLVACHLGYRDDSSPVMHNGFISGSTDGLSFIYILTLFLSFPRLVILVTRCSSLLLLLRNGEPGNGEQDHGGRRVRGERNRRARCKIPIKCIR